ncbi:MAG: hypothetical protein IPQ27_08575 [Chitinophagaceae bacterium]|nr:hypothetical protein [Chitinophagaceae bacterium]
MKRGLLICLIFISFIQPVFARHITGGEVVYEFVSSTPSTRTYVVTLILFRDNLCVNCSVMPPTVSIGVFSNDNNAMIPGNSTGGYWNIALSTVQALSLNPLPNCIQNVPNLSYSGGFYPLRFTLQIITMDIPLLIKPVAELKIFPHHRFNGCHLYWPNTRKQYIRYKFAG